MHSNSSTLVDAPLMSDHANQKHWYFAVGVVLLLLGASLRIWQLGSTPPGISSDELVNIQLSDRMRAGDVSVIYAEAHPAREGLYFALLAFWRAVAGPGLILWRLPSVWISMLSLATMMSLMRRLFGVRPALLAAGLVAVTFWPVWMGRTILHVTLIPLVTTFVIYTLARAYQAEDQAIASMWSTLGGMALGIAQYVHVTAWTLIVLLILFMLYRVIVNRTEARERLDNVLYALILTAVLSIPMIIFLIRHPGAREPVPVTEQPTIIAEIPGRLISSIAALALRGDMLPQHNLPGHPVLGPVLAVLMVVGIGVALARWRRAEYGLALLWLCVGLVPAAFLPHNPDFEYIAVILPVVFLFPALGLAVLYNSVRRIMPAQAVRVTVPAISVLVVGLVTGNALLTYRDYFLIWPSLGDVRLNYGSDLGVLAHYLDTTRDPSPISICTTPVDRNADPFALTNRELLHVLMHRQDLPIRYFDCTQSLVIASGGESQRIIFPRGHYYDHLPGPLLAWMSYAHDERVPGIRPDVVMRFEATDEIANTAGALITTAPTAWPPDSTSSALAGLPIPFAHNVTFMGYTVRDTTLRSTDWVELTTYWRLDGPPPGELTLFAHLLGNPVVVIAQDDGLGVAINTLQPRDIFLQYSMIQTPGFMASGLYPLSVGLYLPSTGERLLAYDSGEPRSNRLFLLRVEITP